MFLKINFSFVFLVLLLLLQHEVFNVNGEFLLHQTFVKASTDALNGPVLAGKPFTIRCEIPNMPQRNEEFTLKFNALKYRFWAYYHRKIDTEEATFHTELPDADRERIVQMLPQKQSYSVYEVTFFTNENASSSSFNSLFACSLGRGSAKDDNYGNQDFRWSNEIRISVQSIKEKNNNRSTTPASPAYAPKLQMTTSQPGALFYLNQPTKVTCLLANADFVRGKKYTVNFYHSDHGLLASYAVDAFEKMFPRLVVYNSTVPSSAKSAYPNFELLITEKEVIRRRSLWCELVLQKQIAEKLDKNTAEQTSFKSPPWQPYGPFAKFTATKTGNKTAADSEERAQAARCSVDQFDNQENWRYSQVQFFYGENAQEKTNQDTLLAQYKLHGMYNNKNVQF